MQKNDFADDGKNNWKVTKKRLNQNRISLLLNQRLRNDNFLGKNFFSQRVFFSIM